MKFTNLLTGLFSNVSSGIISTYQWLWMVGRFGFKSPYKNEVNNSLENDISYDKKLLHLARKFFVKEMIFDNTLSCHKRFILVRRK